MNDIRIAVQEAEFDQNAVYHWLSEQNSVGAAVIFVGKVRELNLGDDVSSLYLEHYPAMTEKDSTSRGNSSCRLITNR